MLYDLDRLFQALADPTRRAILRRLAQSSAVVGEVAALCPTISLAAVSKHLHVLEHAGLATAQREGKFWRFSLKPEALYHLDQWLSHYRSKTPENEPKSIQKAAVKQPQSIALLGLSANPPHLGHLAISRALRGAGYDEVWWSIAPEQEFKPINTLAPYTHRVKLAEILLDSHPGVRLDVTESTLAIEAEHDRTFELMRHLASKNPSISFTFVMGADSWAHPTKGFHTWGKFAEILEYCGILVIPRPDHAEGLDICSAANALQNQWFKGTYPVPRGQWALHPASVAQVSSTNIRAALNAGQEPNGLTPAQTTYIRRHGLYA